MIEQDIVEANIQELRRGTVVLACLVVLRTPDYGYALLERLASIGFPVDANTLYPLLRRLEKQGLLHSEWETSGAKPRKYYELNGIGIEVYRRLCSEWDDMEETIDNLTGKGSK